MALEIVDVDRGAALYDVVAGNVFHRAVAFGPLRRRPIAGSVQATLLVDGRPQSAVVDVDAARTVWNMVQLLAAVDQQLRAGDKIIGGSLLHVSVETGHELTATNRSLGEASLRVDA